MRAEVHIGEATRRLGVTPEHLRRLEREGRVPPPRRDPVGRLYAEADLEIMQALGVGQNPRRLKTLGDLGKSR